MRIRQGARLLVLGLVLGAVLIGLRGLVRHFGSTRVNDSQVDAARVTGTVAGESGPLAGAVVRIKGQGEFVLTDLNGRFSLPRTSPLDQPVTASHADYFIGGGMADASSTKLDIHLKRLPHADNPQYRWVDPTPDSTDSTRCGNCHQQIFEEWQDSGHAASATNRRFLNLFQGTDWHGRADVGANLLADHYDGAAVCGSCHWPSVALDDPARNDVTRLQGVDRHGVHCDFCHKVSGVSVENVGLTHGRFGMTVLRPDEGQLFFGPLDDVDRGEDAFSPVQQTSQYCASCHEGVVFGIHVYSTYSEWLASPASRQGRQCQSCHMTPTGQLTNIAPGFGGIERDPQTLASHSFLPGGRAAMLRRALDVQVELRRERQAVHVTVHVTAQSVGHRVPTGFIDRHLLMSVEAYDTHDRSLEALVGPELPDAAGDELAGGAGRLFARLLADSSGQAPVPFWQATQNPPDTRLRPDEPIATDFEFPPESQLVRVRLIYRRFWPATSREKSWPDDSVVVVDESHQVD